MTGFESVVEEAAIGWLQSLGYTYLHGSVIAPDGEGAERSSYATVRLEGRLREAIRRLNPHLASDDHDEVFRRIQRLDGPALEEDNHAFHRLLTRGIELQVRRNDEVRGDLAHLVDFNNPKNNDWLVVNQLTVTEAGNTRRPDLVVFLNGLPIAVLELKSPEQQGATLKSGWNQLQTYKAQIPSLFRTNEILVLSDGSEARVGSLTAGFEWFGAWRTIDGQGNAPKTMPQLQVLIEGLFHQERLLDYLRHFILWETEDGYVKKLAGYHQFHAVRKSVAETVRAAGPEGNRRAGVVWHTQGSGKSISMAFFAGKLLLEEALANPTLVVLTDRNDLDSQLYAQFCAAKDLVPLPEQAESREDLRDKLRVASGGIVFTTIQKFGMPKGERMPMLSDRRNIIVIADEAHRSQYELIDGFAHNLRLALPNASFIGFTGTPIEFDDRSTPAVFGSYIDEYKIGQSVEDGRTVPIFYEARLARIALPDDRRPVVDEGFEEVTEGEEEETRQKLKTRWARLEAMVGTEERLGLIADDILTHWDRRKEILKGKAMIVCMSRRICVDLYDAIIQRRPEWGSKNDDEGRVKVVFSGAASDGQKMIDHNRTRQRQKIIEKRFKDPADPLELVIVRDMWLTGFDVPCAHTLYLDKPMKGHGLMQAIARVNRVFRDKPAGLIVDYLGLAEQLKKAVSHYGGGRGDKPGVPADVALDVLREKFGVVKDMFHGFDYSGYLGDDPGARVAALAGGANHICGREVAPLSSGEMKRLLTIFGAWEHPEVKGKKAQAARLGDGTADAAVCTLELLEAFLLAPDIGSGNDLLYESTLDALHRLLVQPAPEGLERTNASKALVLQLEPFALKLLALLDPEASDALASKKKGLDTVLIHLGKIGANPYSLKLSPQEFIDRKGGESWTSFEHAVRDVMETRLDAAHRSTQVEPRLWRSAVCVLLGLISHNAEKLGTLPNAEPGAVDGKRRFLAAMTRLNHAAGIAVHLEEAREMIPEIGYFQAVQRNLQKYTVGGSGKDEEELDFAIQQLVSQAVTSDGVVDVFSEAGIKKPDISILSEEFLATVTESPNKNLQLELLRKLMNDEIGKLRNTNVVQSRRFSEMLEQALIGYQNRTLEAAEVILELIKIAREMRDAPKRGDALGLSEDELAFYDALADHGDVRDVMGDETLAMIASELVESIRKSVTIDWTQKASVRAGMRTRIKRLLRKYGYPPDKREEAVVTILQQAEQVCKDWAA